MNRSTIIWLSVVLAAVLMASSIMLVSCGTRYQPPGENLWLAIPKEK